MARSSVSLEGLDLDRAAIESIERGPLVAQVLRVAGDKVRDRARDNARDISADLADAIWTSEPQEDIIEGAYIDVGYKRNHPGFVLWWHEIGTIDFPARPHLRPALSPEL